MAVLPLNTQMTTIQLNVFKQTIRDFAQSLPDEYRGSRLDAHRYTYANTTLANFIELALEHTMEPEDFRALLRKVPGVTAVELHKCSKHDQGNPNAQDPKARTRRKGHYQAQNFMVYSTIFPGIGMEFELTENKHSKDKKKPLTISACYKTQPNRFRALEAWRILRTAVAGKELDSRIVAKVDFELRQLAGATALTDEGLLERFSSEPLESGSPNINDHNASMDDGLPTPRASEDAVSASALKRLGESTVDCMADYAVDHARPRMRPSSKSIPEPEPEADHVLSRSANTCVTDTDVAETSDSMGSFVYRFLIASGSAQSHITPSEEVSKDSEPWDSFARSSVDSDVKSAAAAADVATVVGFETDVDPVVTEADRDTEVVETSINP